MRRSFLCLASGGLLVATAIAAELVITAFNSNGELTWTNSFTNNATYRVEWAGSSAGPWQKFDALTNLTLLSATSNAVTVKVPMVYRVLWLDAPAHAGTYNFSEFYMDGSLVVTGRLSLSAQTHPLTGTWELRQPEGSTNYVGPQTGIGTLYGSLTGSNLFLQLGPGRGDEHISLSGDFVGNTCTGSWYACGIVCIRAGTFIAEKQSGPE